MQNFIEIQQRNLDLLRLDRGMESPRLDRVNNSEQLWIDWVKILYSFHLFIT